MQTRYEILITLALMAAAAGAVVLSLALLENIFVTFVVYYIICCIALPLALMKFVDKKPLGDIPIHLGLKPDNPRPGIIFGVLAGACLFCVMVGGSWFLNDQLFDGNTISEQIEAWGITSPMLVPMLITMFIFNGLAEELFWRGFILKRLEPLQNPILSITAVAFFFTSYHFYPILGLMGKDHIGIFFLVLVFAMGLFWGWSRYRFKSLYPALITHVFATAGYIVIYLALLR